MAATEFEEISFGPSGPEQEESISPTPVPMQRLESEATNGLFGDMVFGIDVPFSDFT